MRRSSHQSQGMRAAAAKAAMDPRTGLTLIEIVVSTGLLTLLAIAAMELVQTTLVVWERAEARRDGATLAGELGDLLVDDLENILGSPAGDLLCEWVSTDIDGDDIADLHSPRLVLVRPRSKDELKQRNLGAGLAPGLVEVAWTLSPEFAPKGIRGPEPDARLALWRIERLIDGNAANPFAAQATSLFETRAFGADGRPSAAARKSAMEESRVSSSALWVRFLFASQTSLVHEGWELGAGPANCSASWDAWNAGRTDAAAHAWNEPPAGMPLDPNGRPLLPRRIRIEFEIEREQDLKYRPALAASLAPRDVELSLNDDRYLPAPGAWIRIDEEWMEVRSVKGKRLGVVRAERETRAAIHEAGAMVHWGAVSVREVSVAAYREDWGL